MAIRCIGPGPSFGFGDRTGLATPGHVAAARSAGDGIFPVFAQQSIREMDRTRRSPERVMQDALDGMSAAGWDAPSGSDADHLKTAADVAATAAAGFRDFTLDPSDHVDVAVDTDDAQTIEKKAFDVPDASAWLADMRNREIELDNGTHLKLDEPSVVRVIAKYGRAIHALRDLGDAVAAAMRPLRQDFGIEISVDETPSPTTLAEHWIVAELCQEHGMPLIAVAPAFPGAFEKGVDHRGDADELRQAFADHAAIARALGHYKLSLHSGSDKLSVYAELARATRGEVHVKTAGTSWLEALRVAARRDVALFRRIVRFSRERYEHERRTYHLSATLDNVPPPDMVDDAAELERVYLGAPESLTPTRGYDDLGRQIVHCTYGVVWNHDELGSAIRALLEAEHTLHHQFLAEHFAMHLRALREGLGG